MRGRPKALMSVSTSERDVLAAFVENSSAPPALVLRAQIVQACARGLTNRQVAAELQIAEHTVAKWRARFVLHRIDGLRDLPRPGAPAVIPAGIVESIRGKRRAGGPRRADSANGGASGGADGSARGSTDRGANNSSASDSANRGANGSASGSADRSANSSASGNANRGASGNANGGADRGANGARPGCAMLAAEPGVPKSTVARVCGESRAPGNGAANHGANSARPGCAMLATEPGVPKSAVARACGESRTPGNGGANRGEANGVRAAHDVHDAHNARAHDTNAPPCVQRRSPRVVGLYLDAEHQILALADLRAPNQTFISPAMTAHPARSMPLDRGGFIDLYKAALLSSLARLTQRATPSRERLERFIQALYRYPASAGIDVFAYRSAPEYSLMANPPGHASPSVAWHSMTRSRTWSADLTRAMQAACGDGAHARSGQLGQPMQLSDALLQAIADYAEKSGTRNSPDTDNQTSSQSDNLPDSQTDSQANNPPDRQIDSQANNPTDRQTHAPEEGFAWVDTARHAFPPATAHREKPATWRRFAAPFFASPRDDLELAFTMAPAGLLVARQRVIEKYNNAFCGMFGYDMATLGGKSLEVLYPSIDEYWRIGERAEAIMRKTGFYSDERIMRRIDGSLFWCHVSGRAIDWSDPFAASVWSFEDISAMRPVTAELTTRERQIAQLLVRGKTSKQIAKHLGISHRTVESHRARLMRKYDVCTASELIAHLVGGHAAPVSLAPLSA